MSCVLVCLMFNALDERVVAVVGSGQRVLLEAGSSTHVCSSDKCVRVVQRISVLGSSDVWIHCSPGVLLPIIDVDAVQHNVQIVSVVWLLPAAVSWILAAGLPRKQCMQLNSVAQQSSG